MLNQEVTVRLAAQLVYAGYNETIVGLNACVNPPACYQQNEKETGCSDCDHLPVRNFEFNCPLRTQVFTTNVHYVASSIEPLIPH